jgi:hypothetical protein
MKMYTIEKVNIARLYLLVLFGVISYVLLMILLISLITLIFPKFNNVALFFVITALVFGNYIYKFSFSKSSEKIQIKLNDKKIVIEESEVLLDNIKDIKFKGARFSYYPKIIIELADAKKINFRMSKNNDFDKLIEGLKTNPKIGNVFRY